MREARPFGLVLAGGQASRLGGGDKTLRELAPGTTMLDVLVARLAPQCRTVMLGANGDPARFARPDLPVLADPPGPCRGPLAGVLVGLDAAAAVRSDGWLLSVPGDTPFVPADLAERLMAACRDTGKPVARATCDGRRHGLVALWSCTLGTRLRHALFERDLRKVSVFQDEAGVVDVPWPATPHDPFFNVNTPEDLAAACRIQETKMR